MKSFSLLTAFIAASTNKIVRADSDFLDMYDEVNLNFVMPSNNKGIGDFFMNMDLSM